MSTKYPHTIQLYNEYLGVSKEIKAQSLWELNLKVDEQKRKWNELELRRREKEKILDLKIQAEYMNTQAEKEQHEYTTILENAVAKNNMLKWETLLKNEAFHQFEYSLNPPKLDKFYQKHNVPKQKFLENFFKSIKNKRLEKKSLATQDYQKALDEFNATKEAAIIKYDKEKLEYEDEQKKHNDSIKLWKEQFEHCDCDSVEKYIRVVLANSQYPEGISPESEVYYDSISKTAIVSFNLPAPEDIPEIIGYKFIARRKSIDPIIMKAKDKNALYDTIIHQITLRTIHEIFSGIYIQNCVESIIFNGWVTGINKATGTDFTACIISLETNRKDFEEINLLRVNTKDCLRGLKALLAGPLYNLAPVKPIMDLNKYDKRFVASVDILNAMETDTNLATMPWEDFEHLIRELFGKIFSRDGAEVRVTQASRDGGVDAIAFDPDPIRGGKFVIQAKRYNKVVPVSACRDLYGTMINEGAAKGILVTTSYYGNDSREFTKDKPITLIDGSNLIHMLNEYGYNFRINLKEE